MQTPFYFLWWLLVSPAERPSAPAQQAIEAEITRLEQLEAQAVLKGDTTTLFRLWAKEFVVNNPDNRVVTAQQVRAFMRTGKIDYASFQRIIEKITVVDNVAIAMGRETTTPQQKTANAGKTVTRRYTNVWVRQAGAWHLTARQATNVVVQ
ncbi:nuclear transport factor 2 family protein [Hymenobacter bucti]|uniref:Nuclear transport factor 2 family protein n=1 Tax=Hymenobacter bucti TaxID=1844114 RepID=A0ABW4QVF9_9BACT